MLRTRPLFLALLVACGGEVDDTDAPAPTGDGVACEDGVCVLSGTLTEDLTLTPDNAWLLRGGVFVGDDVNETVITIEPGTIVYGESSTDGMLVVTRGSRLVAEGTADAPIVFTSSKEPGSRARGDWGGIILNGRAPVNTCDDDGLCEAYGEGGTGWYGGDDADDSSGVLKYVRVEFAGTLISPDNELNGIAFQGVGAGTEVDFVQIHMNADDGVEFFGGTVGVKHVLVTGVGDDSMDWTDGWTGKGQFIVLQQFDDGGDNGIEADNNAEANDQEPRSMPTLSNVTIIGSPDSSFSDLGMLLREGTAGHFHNVVVTGFNEACLDVDNDATFAAATSGALLFENSIVDCVVPYLEDAGESLVVEDFFLGGAGNVEMDPGLIAPFDITAPDYTPAAKLTGGVAPADGWFDDVDFVGAMDAGDDWTAGWTTHELN